MDEFQEAYILASYKIQHSDSLRKELKSLKWIEEREFCDIVLGKVYSIGVCRHVLSRLMEDGLVKRHVEMSCEECGTGLMPEHNHTSIECVFCGLVNDVTKEGNVFYSFSDDELKPSKDSFDDMPDRENYNPIKKLIKWVRRLWI